MPPYCCLLVSFFLIPELILIRGFTPHPTSVVNDKIQHFLTFFFLTLIFYWVIDTTKRRVLNMTITFSLVIDIVSELLQSFLPVFLIFMSLKCSIAISIYWISLYERVKKCASNLRLIYLARLVHWVSISYTINANSKEKPHRIAMPLFPQLQQVI